MKPKLLTIAIVAAVSSAGTAGAQSARDYISVVGSSTVYPFATVVAEQFGKTTDFKTPKIESTGSGGGLKLFCSGVGVATPDITNSSRRIKQSEVDTCASNGVNEIVEVIIGYDGIVVANSKTSPELSLTRQELFQALAKDVPDPKGGDGLVPNPYMTWQDINAELPDVKIEVLGPPPTSGTRDAFVELVMDVGCSEFEAIEKIEETENEAAKAACRTMREDGAFVEAGENDNLIVQKLEANPAALGIFGYSFLEQNADKIQGAEIDGEPPTFENIADGKYPVSRPLYFYVKKAHVAVIPGVTEFIEEFTSDRAWGPDGYLADKGLIPMPDAEREQMSAQANALNPVSLTNK